LALLGKIKGESQDRDHLLPCSPVTSSGIEVKASVDRLIQAKERIGCFDGPPISGRDGRALLTQCINGALIEMLEEIFEADPSLFPPGITSKENLSENYQAFRTLRKTSDTRAIEKWVGKLDIDVVNRWATVENAKGQKPSRPMRQHYAQFELLVTPFLQYTWAV
jgi:hypothetical protein